MAAKRAGRTRAVVAVAALAGALTLGACGQPDTAAIVDGERISESATLEAATQVNEAFGATLQQPLTTEQVLSLLISAPFVNEVADQAGTGTSETLARSYMPNLPDPTPETLEVVRANFALQQLDQEAQSKILTDLRAANVSVNPRFGHFDVSTVALSASSPNWIKADPDSSEPDDTPTGN